MLFAISIRKKIAFSFYLLLLFMAGTVVLTYAIVQRIEQKVLFVEVIDDFLNNTLELRRFEKNYFLYGQDEDFRENNNYLEKLNKFFLGEKGRLRSLITAGKAVELVNTFNSYKMNMNLLQELRNQGDLNNKKTEPIDADVIQRAVRDAGKKITTFAEMTSREEKQNIRHLLHTTRNVLVYSIVVVVILSLAIAAILGRKVVNSLKLLEGYTKKISKGEEVKIFKKGPEVEIRALLMAFQRMMRELKIRQQRLVQTEKLAALGTLLAGVAHELNNPLSNISTSAQILAEELEENDLDFKRSLIGQIETQSDKARDIVKTLLEFSRVKEFTKQKIGLKKLFDETIVLIRGQVPTEVDIVMDVPDDLEIFADKQRIQQVFLNLIKNGIDVVGENGTIWVSAVNAKKDQHEEVEIIIEDNGPGIKPENIKKIFDPFFSTKDVGKGSGLGLFIAHDIVQWHGGRISVESTVGHGTTFIIWLPK